MISNQRVLAIIPARAGSKRLPGKNLMDIAGESLIERTIRQARESIYIDHIVLTTDLHLRVPAYCTSLHRPAELAADDTPMLDVVNHALAIYPTVHDIFVLLQVTSPCRTVAEIDECIKLAKQVGYAVSCTEAMNGPYGCDSHRAPNGAVYAYTMAWFEANRTLVATPNYPMPPERSIDINTLAEFQQAKEVIECQK